MKKNTGGWKKKAILLTAIAGIAAFAVFGDKGLLEVYRLKKERDGILAQNSALKRENTELGEKIRLLKTDNRYIAHIARQELGMIGKNEVVYRLEPSGIPETRH